MNVYIKFIKKCNVLLIKFYEKYINFINFHEKYIKFYVHKYFLIVNTLNLM